MHNNNFYNLIICCLRVIVGQTLQNVTSAKITASVRTVYAEFCSCYVVTLQMITLVELKIKSSVKRWRELTKEEREEYNRGAADTCSYWCGAEHQASFKLPRHRQCSSGLRSAPRYCPGDPSGAGDRMNKFLNEANSIS